MRLVSAFSFFIILAVVFSDLSGQSYELVGGDTINKKDAMGKMQGKWIITGKNKRLPGYSPDAKIEEGSYKDSKKVGVWIGYYSNGKTKNEITYKFGRPNGPYKTYYVTGILEEEGNWDGGKESGTLTEYYENGDLKAKKVFADGTLDEAKTTVYEPKTPVVDRAKQEEKNAPVRNVVASKEEQPNQGHFDGNGHHKLYNKDKILVKDGYFQNYKLIDGKWYKYSDDNILLNIERIKNGRYVGDVPFDEE